MSDEKKTLADVFLVYWNRVLAAQGVSPLSGRKNQLLSSDMALLNMIADLVPLQTERVIKEHFPAQSGVNVTETAPGTVPSTNPPTVLRDLVTGMLRPPRAYNEAGESFEHLHRQARARNLEHAARIEALDAELAAERERHVKSQKEQAARAQAELDSRNRIIGQLREQVRTEQALNEKRCAELLEAQKRIQALESERADRIRAEGRLTESLDRIKVLESALIDMRAACNLALAERDDARAQINKFQRGLNAALEGLQKVVATP